MSPSELRVGVLCKVKDRVWEEWCFRHQEEYKPFTAQPVVQIGVGNDTYDYWVMLAFPTYWWKSEELEPA